MIRDYLTAMLPIKPIKIAVLRGIFDQQYDLTFTEIVEVRYRTETRTDPDTGEEYEIEVPYNWYILETTLTAKPFADVIGPLLAPGDELLYHKGQPRLCGQSVPVRLAPPRVLLLRLACPPHHRG